MKRLVSAALLAAAAALPAFAQERIASDFEIAQMKEQIARSKSFSAQISGHLNLGDLYATRSERTTATAEYTTAREIAAKERVNARRDSDLTRYATATSYASLAEAKLGNGSAAFELAEEAIRYASDDSGTWNLYASAMTIAKRPQKAVAAASNAVQIATSEVARENTIAHRLDLAVYRYSLASALIDAGKQNEAEQLLRTTIDALRAPDFDALRREVARTESFEVTSSTRGDAPAYLSVLNRAQLRLGALLEARGDTVGARQQYERVLQARTDDATALAALARLSKADADRDRYFAAAFDANPFSLPLIREYQRAIAQSQPAEPDPSTTGGQVRSALIAMRRGDTRRARSTLDALLLKFPANETVRTLRNETEQTLDVPSFLTNGGAPRPGELRRLVQLLNDQRLTSEQQAALDRVTLQSVVTFSSAKPGQANQTILESGIVDDVPFRFTEPTIFSGTFEAGKPLRLTYRVLGATNVGDSDGLLIEPLKLELAQ